MNGTGVAGSPSGPSSGSPHFETRAAARSAVLMGDAPGARTFEARLFARLVAAREVRGELALLGLTAEQLAALSARHFAASAVLVQRPCGVLVDVSRAQSADQSVESVHAAYVASMQAFLIDHAARDVDREDAQCPAAIVAQACLRPDHPWRDLGLSGRDDVTAMLARYFPELVARNVEGLRWKKLFARELTLATGGTPGPAPGCPGCEDFGFCFLPVR